MRRAAPPNCAAPSSGRRSARPPDAIGRWACPAGGDRIHPMERDASCHCGKLILRCRGEPAKVSLCHCMDCQRRTGRSEEHTSELQSLMRTAYAVFCLTKKNKKTKI